MNAKGNHPTLASFAKHLVDSIYQVPGDRRLLFLRKCGWHQSLVTKLEKLMYATNENFSQCRRIARRPAWLRVRSVHHGKSSPSCNVSAMISLASSMAWLS